MTLTREDLLLKEKEGKNIGEKKKKRVFNFFPHFATFKITRNYVYFSH